MFSCMKSRLRGRPAPAPTPVPTPAPAPAPQPPSSGRSLGWDGAPAPAPQPVPQPTSDWQWVHPNRGSGGPITQEGEWTTFRFDGYEPHMLLRRTNGPLSGTVRLKWKLEGALIRPVQGSVATVSLMFQRRGDDWSGQDEKASYRWYHAGQPLVTEGALDVPLVGGHWTNVFGKHDPHGFEDAKANAANIGLVFGDPGAGATAHGVTGSGKFSFVSRSSHERLRPGLQGTRRHSGRLFYCCRHRARRRIQLPAEDVLGGIAVRAKGAVDHAAPDGRF